MNADVIVRLSNGRREVEKGKAITVAGDRIEPKVETEGQLIVDLFDRETQRRLYHGVAQDLVLEGKIDDAQIKEAVRRILLSIPNVSHRDVAASAF